MNRIATLNFAAMRASFLFAILALAGAALAQPNLTPGAPQTESILVVGGTAHLGTGEALDNAAIGFEDGIINFVGTAREVDRKRYNRVVDVSGMHVYPGFIAPNSTLGLMEVAAVRASRDYQEVGTFKPNVRSIIAYNAASDITPTVRTNGVLMGQITPRGGVIGGSSSVVQFDAWNWEDAVVRADDGIHLYWPSYPPQALSRTDGRSCASARPTTRSCTRSGTSLTGPGLTRQGNREAGLADGGHARLVCAGARNAAGATTLFVHANDAKQIAEVIRFKRAETWSAWCSSADGQLDDGRSACGKTTSL